MKKDKEKVMYASDDSASIKTVTGWVDRHGRFFGQDEHMARWSGSTHKLCECGGEMSKTYTRCPSCRNNSARERFLALEAVEWDGKSMMCEYDGEEFFADIGDVYDHLEHNDIPLSDAQIMLCEKSVRINEINIDELNEEYTTMDGKGVSDHYPEIAKKVKELNKVISEAVPVLWFPTNKRIKL